MNKNIENTRMEKLPTSQLVLYMTSPDLVDSKTRLQIEEYLFKRLTSKYKLYPDRAKKFVEREQEIIGLRGYDMESYSFGRDLLYEELFKIFYENVNISLEDEKKGTNLYNLTMSEIAEYWTWFITYKDIFTNRQRSFDKEIKKNKSTQKDILNSNTPFADKEKEINQLVSLSKELNRYKAMESGLIGYNEMASLFMFSEIKKIMGYSDFLRTNITLLKELFLIGNASPRQKMEMRQYKDLDFDAYSHYSAPIVKYRKK